MTLSDLPSPGLGTLLRHVTEMLDGEVAAAYAAAGLHDYRPRFTPVVRALGALGPTTVREIAAFSGVTHSAASQTVSEMATRKFVTRSQGKDARERIVRLTPRLKAILPELEAHWAATARAESALNAALPFSLRDCLLATLTELKRCSFSDRIAAAGLPRRHDADPSKKES